MSHTYANLPAFKDYLRDGGSAGTATTNDVLLLEDLEGSSRAVDTYCDRSPRFGSGFGPRQGTNDYDVWEFTNVLQFRDDLLVLDSISLLDATRGVSIGSVAENTDYFLRGRGAYAAPYREFILHGQGSVTALGWGYKVVSGTGKWGYQDVRASAGTAGTATSSATSVSITGGAVYAGQTVLWGTEQIYVTASVGGTALTVERGVNGTTAAAHGTAIAVEVYRYPVEVVEATLEIAQRRWKARQAGGDGNLNGPPMPGQAPLYSASEWSILNRKVQKFKVYASG